MLSPEEVAREFLQEGRGVTRKERKVVSHRRRVGSGVATAVGIVCAIAVLVVLAVVTLSTNRAPSPPSTTGPSTTAQLSPSSVKVAVLNADGSGALLAIATQKDLDRVGFVTSVGNATTQIAPDGPTEILYGPSGLPAAETLAQWLSGPVKTVPSAQLSGNDLELLVANPQLAVKTTTTAAAAATAFLSSAHSSPPVR